MRCIHCGIETFVDDDGIRRHMEHEGQTCGTPSPDTIAEVEPPYFIDPSYWHTILHREHGLILRVYPHGGGSFMGNDNMASDLAIKVCNWLNAAEEL